MNGLTTTMERKTALSTTEPQRHTTLRAAADSLSLRNADAAIVELYMEAMQRLTLLAYETDAHGYCNIDPATSKLLIPAPWGRAGHLRWGITPSESVVLREMVQRRQIGRDGRPPGLWLYDSTRRCWRLNLYDFDTLADAQRYWKKFALTVAEYRQARSKRLEAK
jgi:hypothetical protein